MEDESSHLLTPLNEGPNQDQVLGDIENSDNDNNNKSVTMETDYVRELQGFVLCVVGCFLATVSAVCVKQLQEKVPDIQLNGMRFSAIFVMTSGCLAIRRTLPRVTVSGLSGWRKWAWLLLWALAGIHANLFHFTSIMYINLGQSLSVSRVLYMFFAALVTRIIIKDRLTNIQIVSVAIGTVAIVMVYQRQVFPWLQPKTTTLLQNQQSVDRLQNLTQDLSRMLNATDSHVLLGDNMNSTSDVSTLVTKSTNFTTDVIIGLGYRNNIKTVTSGAGNNTFTEKVTTSTSDNFLTIDGTTRTSVVNSSLPGGAESEGHQNHSPNYHSDSISSLIIGIALATGTAVLLTASNGIQKVKFPLADVWVITFWYGLIGAPISLIESAILETQALPSDGHQWMLLFLHCFGGGSFGITNALATQLASLVTVSLALGFYVLFYFIAQFIFFPDSTSLLGSEIEIVGFILVVISASLDPAYKMYIHCRRNK